MPPCCATRTSVQISVCRVCSASVFIFGRERGRSTPLSILAALTQTHRGRGKREAGKERFRYVRENKTLFQRLCDGMERLNAGGFFLGTGTH